MRDYLRYFTPVTVVAALAFVSFFVSLSTAQEEWELSPPPNEEAETIPAPAWSHEVVRPAPRIKYATSRSARRMLRCHDQIEMVMVTCNPADGCLYEIPLCLPACCAGEPQVSQRRGIFGRGVVEYCWECGFTATVKFRQRIGDVKVEYDT
jgi:hypothetical protein